MVIQNGEIGPIEVTKLFLRRYCIKKRSYCYGGL